MPEFLTAPFANEPAVPPLYLLVRLIVAMALGWIVALVYRRTRPPTHVDPSIPATLLLLSILIAMVTQVVGTNIARAFSLVGALSIVRFRTVVADTQDTAFVIFAVVVGMSVGAADLWVALSGLFVVSFAAILMRDRLRSAPAGLPPFVLNVRVGLGHDMNALLASTIGAHAKVHRLLSIGTAKQGMAIEASYETLLNAEGSAEELVKALNRLDGVQNVELQRQSLRDD